MFRFSRSAVGLLTWLSGFSSGVALLLYDEIITAAKYQYCYPYPFIGCFDPYTASMVPFVMLIVSAVSLVLLGSKHQAAKGEESAL